MEKFIESVENAYFAMDSGNLLILIKPSKIIGNWMLGSAFGILNIFSCLDFSLKLINRGRDFL